MEFKNTPPDTPEAKLALKSSVIPPGLVFAPTPLVPLHNVAQPFSSSDVDAIGLNGAKNLEKEPNTSGVVGPVFGRVYMSIDDGSELLQLAMQLSTDIVLSDASTMAENPPPDAQTPAVSERSS
jgi:hypothetical protein